MFARMLTYLDITDTFDMAHKWFVQAAVCRFSQEFDSLLPTVELFIIS